MELCDLSAHELAALLRQRKVSAVEILKSALGRIRAVDGRPGSIEPGALTPEDEQRVHAFISFTEEQARVQAEAADRKIAESQDPGPLGGIPFSVKDIFCVRGTLFHRRVAHPGQFPLALYRHAC